MTSPTGDWRERAVVPDGKISAYLLSETHGVGRFKAHFLMRHGFDPARPDELRSAILTHLRQATVWTETANPYGRKFIVVAALPSPDGREPLVRSIWFEEGEGSDVLLVTLYPHGGRQ